MVAIQLCQHVHVVKTIRITFSVREICGGQAAGGGGHWGGGIGTHM